MEECQLLTSYRSTPEVTELFCRIAGMDEGITRSSVRDAGSAPELLRAGDADDYVATLRGLCEKAAESDGLTAVIVSDRARERWLAKRLDGVATRIGSDDSLPAGGVVLMELGMAKGLEFDHVVVADAQAEAYPDTPLARRRLYTAVSRAMHRVTLVAQGEPSPLLKEALS